MHVAHVIIDGGIDIPRLAEYKSRFNGGAPDGMLSPDAVSTCVVEKGHRGRASSV